jgi:hypothetical protein
MSPYFLMSHCCGVQLRPLEWSGQNARLKDWQKDLKSTFFVTSNAGFMTMINVSSNCWKVSPALKCKTQVGAATQILYQDCQMVYIFSYQKCQFRCTLEGLRMETYGVSNGQLVFLLQFWCSLPMYITYIFLWTFLYIFPILVCCTKKTLAIQIFLRHTTLFGSPRSPDFTYFPLNFSALTVEIVYVL